MTNIEGKKGFFWNKVYVKELLLSLYIFFSPFFIFIHVLFNFDEEARVMHVFGITIAHDFMGNNIFIWILLGNVIPITLLVTWFFVTQYPWKYLILLPASIFIRSLLFMLLGSFSIDLGVPKPIPVIACMGVIIMIDLFYSKKRRKRIVLDHNFENYLNLNSKRFYDSLIEKWNSIKKDKKETSLPYYLKNIYHLKTLLSKRHAEYGFSNLPSFKLPDRTINWFVCISLVGVYLFYRLNYMIDRDLLEMDLGFIVFGKNGFFSFWAFFLYFSKKIAILLPLCIWYSTSRNWWKYAILSPIFLYTYQTWEMFQETKAIEGWGNIKIFPVLILVLLALTFISRTIRYESKIMDVQEQIVDEIEDLLQKQEDEDRVRKDKFALERLRVEVASNEAKQQQLDALLSLKQRLEDQLLEK